MLFPLELERASCSPLSSGFAMRCCGWRKGKAVAAKVDWMLANCLNRTTTHQPLLFTGCPSRFMLQPRQLDTLVSQQFIEVRGLQINVYKVLYFELQENISCVFGKKSKSQPVHLWRRAATFCRMQSEWEARNALLPHFSLSLQCVISSILECFSFERAIFPSFLSFAGKSKCERRMDRWAC